MSNRNDIDFDEMVAIYAPIGRQQRGERWAQLRRKYVTGAAGVLTMSALALTIWQGSAEIRPDLYFQNVATLNAMEAQLQQAQSLHANINSELDGVRLQREELQEQYSALVTQKAALDTQKATIAAELSTMAQQRTALENQAEAFAAQRSELAAATAEVEQNWLDLEARRAQFGQEGPRIETEIRDITVARQELDAERARFYEQRELLNSEIGKLASQREALNGQRQELEAESRELQAAIDEVDDRQRRLGQQAIEAQEPLGQADIDQQIEQELDAGDMFASATSTTTIGESELGEMRGGIDLGDKLDIAIGLTRSVSINGVEEYTSAFQLGSSGEASADQLASLGAIVVQTGSGNMITTSGFGAGSTAIPTIIQNTLDDQNITSTNILDVTISNVGGIAAGISAGKAIDDSLSSMGR